MSITICSSKLMNGHRILTTVLLLAVVFAATTGSATVVQTTTYMGTAYGTSAFLGNSVIVGQTAPITMGGACGTGQQNASISGTSAGLNLFPIVTGGVTNTSASSATQSAQASSTVTGISLLAGLITADAIVASSATAIDNNNHFSVNPAGSGFTNLNIAGQIYNGNVNPNTTVNLLGLGYVVLNEQTTNIGNSLAQLTVNMLHIHITGVNLLGLQTGTEIIVGSANSGMVHLFSPAIVTGGSFATQVTGNPLASSATAPEALPCLGTAGATQTASLAGINLAGILNSGTVSDTVESKLLNPISTGHNTSSVENLNLLNGLVTASVMKAQVNALTNNRPNYILNGVGQFVGLSVAGHPEITDNVTPNTTVPLAGLGTLYLYRVINNYPNPHSVEVRMLELVVDQNNILGLPIGLDVIIGDANIELVGNVQ